MNSEEFLEEYIQTPPVAPSVLVMQVLNVFHGFRQSPPPTRGSQDFMGRRDFETTQKAFRVARLCSAEQKATVSSKVCNTHEVFSGTFGLDFRRGLEGATSEPIEALFYTQNSTRS